MYITTINTVPTFWDLVVSLVQSSHRIYSLYRCIASIPYMCLVSITKQDAKFILMSKINERYIGIYLQYNNT